MNFIKNHFYIDKRNKTVLIFDSMLKATDSIPNRSDIYFFTEVETYFPRLYFGKEIEYLKEY